VHEISIAELLNILEGRSRWRVARMGKKTTMKVIMWGRIRF
jgi:hypothetical protein